jgi:hypothetical protein
VALRATHNNNKENIYSLIHTQRQRKYLFFDIHTHRKIRTVARSATHTDKEIIYSLTYTPTAKFALWRYAPPTPTQRKYLFFDTETGSKIRTVALRATHTDTKK